jgi:8-oxo-dGTP pyrophosphatase MutT (NUDIX family)
MGNMRVQNTVSAGGVVYRRSQDGLEIVLCGRTGPGTWSLPKGTPNAGESIEETALREVREETGLRVELEEPLGNINYWFTHAPDDARYHKTVHFYLMAVRGGSVDFHDPEFDTVRWFSAQEALDVMTHPNEATVVRRALDALAERGLAYG